ncbi:DNA repair protein RecO C-terminal domain-containing protein [Lagierella sp.]|uniref:DNA repair protein RecO n=1 Tax=Lagierella sp. TaxID=2849657 RepID=UPI00262A2FEA|nr:DNA repair protein RecO C-terminal domain-containing protein [Lagierella sp.]
MDNKETKIIVLNYFNLREKSRIISCFSRDFGKIDLNLNLTGLNSKNNLLDVFSEHYCSLTVRPEISIMREHEIISSNYGIVKNPQKNILGNIVLELLSKIYPKLYPDSKTYDLTSVYLQNMSLKNNENLLTIAYMLKLLGINGYRTTFNFSKEELIQGRNYYYNVDEGGIDLKPNNYSPVVVLDYNQCNLIKNLLFAKFEEIPDFDFQDGYMLLKTIIQTIMKIFEIGKLNSLSYLRHK